MPEPASNTKHLKEIVHPLPKHSTTLLTLSQISSVEGGHGQGSTSTGTTGTTLWTGGQVLACYLSSLNTKTPPKNPDKEVKVEDGDVSDKSIIELGAGIGYLSLVCASLGYRVISSDIQPVVDKVLTPNIQNGLRVLSRSNQTPVFNTTTTTIKSDRAKRNLTAGNPIGHIEIIELDWTKNDLSALEGLECSVIITSDTIYHLPLVTPLFQTIATLAESYASKKGKSPLIYISLERRDDRFIDLALNKAAEFGICLAKIGNGRVARCLRESGWGWVEDDWHGVEIWKGRWSPPG